MKSVAIVLAAGISVLLLSGAALAQDKAP